MNNTSHPASYLRGEFLYVVILLARINACFQAFLRQALPLDSVSSDSSGACPGRNHDDGAGHKDQVRQLLRVDSSIHMHHHYAAYLFHLKRYPYRNDHLCDPEHDLRQLQEDHSRDQLNRSLKTVVLQK